MEVDADLVPLDSLSIQDEPSRLVEKDETSTASTVPAEKDEQSSAVSFGSSEREGKTINALGTDASMHADPCTKARRAFEKLKKEVAELGKVYSNAVNYDEPRHVRAEKRKLFEEAQHELEASRRTWRLMFPTRLEFFSDQEIEEAKRQAVALQEKSRKTLIVPKALPALQLVGMIKHNDHQEVHTSAAAFISAFEVELETYGLTAEENWRRLLPRCLSSSQKLWLTE